MEGSVEYKRKMDKPGVISGLEDFSLTLVDEHRRDRLRESVNSRRHINYAADSNLSLSLGVFEKIYNHIVDSLGDLEESGRFWMRDRFVIDLWLDRNLEGEDDREKALERYGIRGIDDYCWNLWMSYGDTGEYSAVLTTNGGTPNSEEGFDSLFRRLITRHFPSSEGA